MPDCENIPPPDPCCPHCVHMFELVDWFNRCMNERIASIKEVACIPEPDCTTCEETYCITGIEGFGGPLDPVTVTKLPPLEGEECPEAWRGIDGDGSQIDLTFNVTTWEVTQNGGPIAILENTDVCPPEGLYPGESEGGFPDLTVAIGSCE